MLSAVDRKAMTFPVMAFFASVESLRNDTAVKKTFARRQVGHPEIFIENGGAGC